MPRGSAKPVDDCYKAGGLASKLRLALELFDVEPEAYEHEGDGEEADAEADAAMIALDHGVVAGFEVGGGDRGPGLNVRIDQSGLEGVDGDAGFGKRILGLILGEAGLADFHAGGFGEAQGLVGVLDGGVKLS